MTKENNSDNSEENSHRYSPEIVERFVDTQEKELQIKQQELAQRERESEYNYQLAQRSIEAQERDREAHRNYFKNHQKNRYIFVTIISILILIFLGFTIWKGETELVMDIVKIVSYLVAGGLGGYAIGYNKATDKNTPED